MKQFFIGLLDWIYKKKCYFCRKSKECVKMCSECYDEMEYLPVKVNRIIEGKNIYCAGIYEKNLQKLIRGLKYHNQPDLAYYLAKFMWEYFENVTDERVLSFISFVHLNPRYFSSSFEPMLMRYLMCIASYFTI